MNNLQTPLKVKHKELYGHGRRWRMPDTSVTGASLRLPGVHVDLVIFECNNSENANVIVMLFNQIYV